MNIWNALTAELFELRKKNGTVKGIITNLKENKPQAIHSDSEVNWLPTDLLLQHLDRELDRRRVIEEKAKTNVLAITLSFSAMLIGVALISRVTNSDEQVVSWLVWAFALLQIYGALLLLTGGLLALHALRAVETYLWTLADESRGLTDEMKHAEISWYVELNQYVTTLKSNSVDVSYCCIRNGLCAFAAAAVVAMVILVIPRCLT